MYHHENADGSGPFGNRWDEACIDAFERAFSMEEFLALDASDLEKRLWDKVPRIKQELDFSQIQAVAEFFARIVDYKSPFASTHSIGVAQDAEKLTRYLGFDEMRDWAAFHHERLDGSGYPFGKTATQ